MTIESNVGVSLLLAVLLAGCSPAPETSEQGTASQMPDRKPLPAVRSVKSDPLQATYSVNGPITLVDGRSERAAAPGSATREMTSVLGEPVYGDLDGDGVEDAALLLVDEPGGSGTFVYVAAARQERDQFVGSDAILLGDRIGSPTLAIRDGAIDVHFLDRPDGATFADAPTMQRSLQLALDGETMKLRKVTPPGAD